MEDIILKILSSKEINVLQILSLLLVFLILLNGHSASFPSGKNQGGDLRFTSSDGSTRFLILTFL